ncbi:guanine deaminase-like [Pollicipes pollicipes]|uniref:guanine deaminase-like n=1 Tax=Pollicipes pollicipes TaxID=41117 RepID=UPI0018855980|nr:guanine deaminase-like [Pollicipes pollicipes]
MSREQAVPDVQLFQGTVAHATAACAAEVLPDAVLVVERGRVTHLGPASGLTAQLRRLDAGAEAVVQLSPHQLLLPGLVDAHIHPCQYPNAGLALDLPLLDWLQRYTYPTEARFQDEAFASTVYAAVVDRTLRNGTTCASYFASIHRPATERLAELCRERGQRALVGKTCMDQQAPTNYCETTDQSLQEATAFARGQLARRCPLVLPSVTPRFAITCSERLLAGLGQLAAEHGLHVQTHVNETRNEVAMVRRLFPEAASYTDVYRRAGLLGPRTVLAHCVHPGDDELTLLRDSGTGVAHCANSNASLRSGLCDVRRLETAGVQVGLGTDMSGGYHPSVLDAIRTTLHTSNVHAIYRDDYQPLTFRDGLRLATLGGAAALGLADSIGNFEPGKQFDAMLVSLGGDDSDVDLLTPHSPDELLQKFIYLGDSRDIAKVYVAGREVHSRTA